MTALLLLSLLLHQVDAGTATPLAFEQQVTPDAVQLGEPFTLELTVTHAADARYELVPPRDMGAFELLGQTRERQDAPGGATTRFKLQLSGFELGRRPLPAFTFLATSLAGVQPFAPPPASVEVRSSLPPATGKSPTAELKDLKAPEEVAVRSWRLVWAVLGVLALGAALYALVRFLKARKARALPPAPALPLHVRTLQALDALQSEGLPAHGRSQEFYFRLSEIVRRYLGERYAFEALECTSSELLASIHARATPGLPEPSLRDFILESDLVKYAKADATPDSCARSLDFSYSLVESTSAPAPAPHAPGPHVP